MVLPGRTLLVGALAALLMGSGIACSSNSGARPSCSVDAACPTSAGADGAAADGAADSGEGDGTPVACQGPVCGGTCCSQYQTGCGIDVGTGLEICCDTRQNFICAGSSFCCSKQTSQCVVDTDPESGSFQVNLCESCQDAGCD